MKMSNDLIAKRIAFVVNARAGRELKSGETDTSNVITLLRDQDIGCCDPKESFHLYNCESEIQLLDELNTFSINWNANNQLIFYYSGHGTIFGDKFALQFGDKLKSYLLFDNLIENLYFIKKIKNAIIIIDSCHSGAITERVKGEEKIPSKFPKSIPEGIAYIASSSRVEKSFELPTGEGSLFTYLFCKGLKSGLGGRKTEQGIVLISDIVDYINNELNKTEYLTFIQSPKYQISGAKSRFWIAKNISGSSSIHTSDEKKIITSERELKFLYKTTDELKHPCIDATIEELDWDLVEQYFKKENDKIKWDKSNKEKILNKLNFFSPIPYRGKQLLHKEAVICFHKFPHKSFRFLDTKIIIGEPGSNNFIVKTVNGPIGNQIKEILNIVKNNSDIYFFNSAGQRLNSSVLKESEFRVIRELVSNAFAHRDYNLQAPIQIIIHPEYIEVKSPGKFPKGLTFDALLQSDSIISRPVNIAISHYLKTQLEFEGIGRGFSVIKEYIKIKGKDCITFKELGKFIISRISIVNTKASNDRKIGGLKYIYLNSLDQQEIYDFFEGFLLEKQEIINEFFELSGTLNPYQDTIEWLFDLPADTLHKATSSIEKIFEKAINHEYGKDSINIKEKISTLVAARGMGLSVQYLKGLIASNIISPITKLELLLLLTRLYAFDNDNLWIENQINIKNEPYLAPVLITIYNKINPAKSIKTIEFLNTLNEFNPSKEFLPLFKWSIRSALYNYLKINYEDRIIEFMKFKEKLSKYWIQQIVNNSLKHPKFYLIEAKLSELSELPKKSTESISLNFEEYTSISKLLNLFELSPKRATKVIESVMSDSKVCSSIVSDFAKMFKSENHEMMKLYSPLILYLNEHYHDKLKGMLLEHSIAVVSNKQFELIDIKNENIRNKFYESDEEVLSKIESLFGRHTHLLKSLIESN